MSIRETLLQLSSRSVRLWGRMASCARVGNPRRFAPIANRRAGCQPAPHSSIGANLDAVWVRHLNRRRLRRLSTLVAHPKRTYYPQLGSFLRLNGMCGPSANDAKMLATQGN